MPRAERLVHAVVEPEPGNWSPKFPGERARHSVSRTISSSTLGFGLRSGTPSGRRPGQRADLHKVRLGQARRRSPIPLCVRRSEVEGLPDSSAWAPAQDSPHRRWDGTSGWAIGRDAFPRRSSAGQKGGGPRISMAPVVWAASRTLSKSTGGGGEPGVAGSLACR